ncbi:hypothetical protein [Lentzea sp. NPDC003310]|uniref:hypothetical protein n=1 Tax=Lentzea sp. NPDC003310 TaxID=3154447 RepID=UPI0033A942EF
MNAPPVAPPMRFNVEGWEIGYGSSLDVDEELSQSKAELDLGVEVPEASWRPVGPTTGITEPDAVLFVDGVRRIDAQVWIDEGDDTAALGICASYAAGVVVCQDSRAEVVHPKHARGVFSTSVHVQNIETPFDAYEAVVVREKPQLSLQVVLSSALQEKLTLLEIETAARARETLNAANDLLVVDGQLRGREHLERAVGYIKSHNKFYLPDRLNAMVPAMAAGHRTPVFRMGTTWERYSWYLRLPHGSGSPWAGVVRVEANEGLSPADVVALANLTQSVLGRYASAEYKDARAPQNLYPIAGLEKNLRHRLGDQQLLYRGLRAAAHFT